ncbi:nitrate reductase [Arenicella xantha]|uniref:Assimilatory nitrate reductase (NADH) alpha subunit apoprotein n=1 Tax=Arenicella xantha TaxID=644221 RepID=A0A395JP72_9GAMM|nr:nitrate reductase [Arenicella xantha]RBP53450.1 assimilatory nitrate reductase (NADH) alpha subunit apoprotein [Arenicella xantha]
MPEILSTCPYCGVGCGVSVSVLDDDVKTVLATPTHPANYGRLCSKGSNLKETLLSVRDGNRLTHPVVYGEAVSWSEATQTIARKIEQSIAQYGRDSVAFYLSGQLLTEDYYVANKLMKGFIGTANVDTNSRLCMSSAVAAYKRAFGSDSVPCCYEDLDVADLIVLVGSNAAWTHPVLYQRMVAAKANNPNMRVVSIDPRQTATNDLVDLHLPLLPSTDGFLFQGLLRYLIQTDGIDQGYIDRHTDGFEAAANSAEAMSLERVSRETGLDQSLVQTFFDWFLATPKTVSFYSQGINQSATGTDKCNAIINCHLATGRLGYAGAGPFSITGQPNAMGGREVGGLANQLAAHMDFSSGDIDRVQRFWNSPRIANEAGLKAVDLFEAVAEGKIKVLWIMATNPAVSLPNSNKIRAALEICPTVIVSDVTHTDTSDFADIVLPALGWGEKDGSVTNSERRISRQRAFRQAPGSAKADWWAITQVAHQLGFQEYFPYQSPHAIFVEHAALSGFENQGSRAFDISGLSDLSELEYQELTPIQWPVTATHPQGTDRLFEDGQFYTASGRAQFVSGKPKKIQAKKAEFILNTGRLRDQWHTMTRTGAVPALTVHDPLPFVQINPEDALTLGIKHHQFVQVSNVLGRVVMRAEVSQSIASGQLFSPIHWNQQFATHAVVCNLIESVVDPVSGQPESKAAIVAIEPYDCGQWVYVVSRAPIDKHAWVYWAESVVDAGLATLVGTNAKVDWRQWVLNTSDSDLTITQYQNPIDESEVIAAYQQDQLEILLFVAVDASRLPSLTWLNQLYANPQLVPWSDLLRGEAGGADELICSCFGTTRKAIELSIDGGTSSIEELSSTLGCGSKCGSCKPELNYLIANR